MTTGTAPTFADLLDGLALEADEIRADVAAVVTEARKRLASIEANVAEPPARNLKAPKVTPA